MSNPTEQFKHFLDQSFDILEDSKKANDEVIMRVELIEEQRYNETWYFVKVDGSYVAGKKSFEEAREEFLKASSFTPKTTVLEVREVKL